jgi:hypothetical protein
MSSVTPELQFERVEEADPAKEATTVACAGCRASITSYFEVNGRIACERCRDAVAAARRAPHTGPMLRATGLGLLAAILGSLIYYGVAELTGYEIGLISIVVGLLVGLAVRKGARKRGGWRYQALAMFLTYLAIASTYVPRVIEASRKHHAQSVEAGSTATTPAPASASVQGQADGAAASRPAPRQERSSGPVTFGGFLAAIGILLAFSLALPFLAGLDNIMGLVLIAIGLFEAWKVNKAAPFKVTGPYQVGAKTAS